MKEKRRSSDVGSLSDADILGQMSYVFGIGMPGTLLIRSSSLMLLAGTDTTSTTISRALEMLSLHRDVQDKLRRELEETTTNTGQSLSEMDSDSFAELQFLNAVVRETLRMCVYSLSVCEFLSSLI